MGAMSELKLKKSFGNSKSSASQTVATELCLVDMEKEFPLLRQFLIGWQEGSAVMEGGFLGMFVSKDGPRAMLTHTQAAQKAFVAGLGFFDLFGSLEKGLAQQDLNWRTEEQSKSRRRK